MAKCTKENALGGLLSDMEFSGKKISQSGYKQLKPGEKMGYAGRSSTGHARGSKEDFPDLYAELEQLKREKGIDVKPSGVAFFRHANKLVPETHTQAIGKAVDSWKQTVIKGDLTQSEARALWQKEVKPVVQEQEKLYKQSAPDAVTYKKQRIQNYFDDLKEGEWLFGGSDNPVAKVVRRGAGYVTGYDMTISVYDMFELLYKGSTVHNPLILARGVAQTLFKGGPKAFGRMAENREFYASFDFPEEALSGKAQLGKKVNWLMDHMNPQYYSNNLLVNVSAEMGRISGMGPAESVEKIAFIPKLENTPEYMRRGAAEMTWARYGTEAFKYYLDIHANLGRGLMEKDPKATIGALSQIATWYGLASAFTGSRTVAPPIVGDFLSLVTKNDSEEDIFDQIDKIPAFNLMEKASGLDMSKSLRTSAPLYGLAYSNFTSQASKLETTGQRIFKALKGDDPAEAFKAGMDALFIGTTLAFGVNPITNKSTNEWLDLAIDYHTDEIDAEEFQFEAKELVFGKKVVNK